MANEFKIGVCVTKNGMINPYSFYPQEIAGTLSGDEAKDATILNINTITHPNPINFARSGDIIQIGPSSNTIYKGNSEVRTISSVTTTTIILSQGLSFAYDENDTFSLLGTALPGGWRCSHNNLNYLSAQGTYVAGSAIAGGYLEKHRLKMWFLEHDTEEQGYNQVYQDFGSVFEATKVYKAGLYYKSSEGGTPDLELEFGIERTVIGPSFESVALPIVADWTNVETDTFNLGTTHSNVKAAIRVTGGTSHTPHYYSLWANYFYFCHAHETDDAADGIYTFDDYPLLGSVSVEEVAVKPLTLIDSSLVFWDKLGLSFFRPRFKINATFDRVDNTFLQNLRILDIWQRQGALLVFQHNTPDLLTQGVPPILVGRMILSPPRTKSMWDLSKVSFDFSFVEGS